MIGLDTVELLDILGNENRRRILQLLSFRPFYFNEMAKRLDSGPKAVINHLDMLERAGLVECYHDSRRRKYFRIAENVVLEVEVSPHAYGVRTYRPECVAKKGAALSSDLNQLRSKLDELEEKRGRLRSLLEEVESEMIVLKRHAIELIEECAEDPLEAEILIALTSGGSSAESLSNRLRMPVVMVEASLQKLSSYGTVQKTGDKWTISGALP